jgi:hypothetical protein
MYSSRLFNSTKRNYNTTKKKALTMVYALHKFRHYLLGNRFTFFMDHMAIDFWQINYLAPIIFGI